MDKIIQEITERKKASSRSESQPRIVELPHVESPRVESPRVESPLKELLPCVEAIGDVQHRWERLKKLMLVNADLLGKKTLILDSDYVSFIESLLKLRNHVDNRLRWTPIASRLSSDLYPMDIALYDFDTLSMMKSVVFNGRRYFLGTPGQKFLIGFKIREPKSFYDSCVVEVYVDGWIAPRKQVFFDMFSDMQVVSHLFTFSVPKFEPFGKNQQQNDSYGISIWAQQTSDLKGVCTRRRDPQPSQCSYQQPTDVKFFKSPGLSVIEPNSETRQVLFVKSMSDIIYGDKIYIETEERMNLRMAESQEQMLRSKMMHSRSDIIAIDLVENPDEPIITKRPKISDD